MRNATSQQLLHALITVSRASSELFQGSDGHEYKWKLGKMVDSSAPYVCNMRGSSVSLIVVYMLLQLVRHDNMEKERIAVFTPKSGLFSSSNHPALLEVSPEGYPIMDEIVLTFIYVEEKRREREESHVDAGG